MNPKVEETQSINEQGQIVITRTVYLKRPVSESQKRASRNWIDSHPEKRNEYARAAYKRRVQSDPDYLAEMRQRNRDCYQKRKQREKEFREKINAIAINN